MDDVTKENIKEHNLNGLHILDHPYRILIIGDSASEKKNSLLNRLNLQLDVDKIYIYMLKIHMKENEKVQLKSF